MVEPQPSKLAMPVRSWSSAPRITAGQRLVKEVEAVKVRGAITLSPVACPGCTRSARMAGSNGVLENPEQSGTIRIRRVAV